MGAIVAGLVTKALPGLFRAWRNRQDRQQTKTKIRESTGSKVQLTAAQVRLMQAQDMSSSLKDEWFCLVLSLPWLAAFFSAWFPSLGDASDRMIGLVGQDAYTYLLTAAVAASFGIRALK